MCERIDSGMSVREGVWMVGWSIITFFSHLTSGVWESVTIPKTFTVIFFGNFLGSSSLPRDVIVDTGIMRFRPNLGKFDFLLP